MPTIGITAGDYGVCCRQISNRWHQIVRERGCFPSGNSSGRVGDVPNIGCCLMCPTSSSLLERILPPLLGGTAARVSIDLAHP